MASAPSLKAVATATTDDAIRERHGCSCREAGDNSPTSVTVWEGEQSVFIDGNHRNRSLTPWQARYLASKLYRLSRRIRQRAAQVQP